MKQKRGSANEEVGEVTMNFAKQRGSGQRTKIQIHLDQIEPDTRKIVNTFVEDIEEDSTKRHTFQDLPLGYEYWGKARTFIQKPKGDRVFSEFEEYKNVVHLRPEKLRLRSEEHKTDEMILRFQKPAGHIDQIVLTVTKTSRGPRDHPKIRKPIIISLALITST